MDEGTLRNRMTGHRTMILSMVRPMLFCVTMAWCTVAGVGACLADEHPELARCRALIAEGKTEEAGRLLAEFRRGEPDNPGAIFWLARIEDDPDRALALYREVELLALMPGRDVPDTTLAAESVVARAGITLALGKYAETVDICGYGIATYPSGEWVPRLHNLQGRALLADGGAETALAAFQRCLELEPAADTRLSASAGIMECRVALGEWTEALEAARRVLNESDDESALTPRVLEVIARAWRELGNDENADWYTERLLVNYPDSYQAHAVRVQGTSVARDMGLNLDGAAGDEGARETDADKPALTGEPSAAPGESPGKPAKGPLFSVQASALENGTNALRMRDTLKEKGFDARIDMKTVRDKHLFIVRVGFFESREAAQSVMERVSAAIDEKAIVVMVDR